jgi:hypothetical protein
MELSGQPRVPPAYTPTGNPVTRRGGCTQLELRRLARAGGVEHGPHPDTNLAPLDALLAAEPNALQLHRRINPPNFTN